MSRPGSHRSRTINDLAALGIGSERIRFVDFQPLDQYLRTYHEIDIGLDTFHYNGHTTSLDSYWMGVPVVTLVGNTAVGRAGSSHLSNLGLGDLAARDAETYVKIAVDLASDLPRLAGLRSELRDRMRRSSLMNAAQFAGGIESAYRQMWRNWCTDQPQLA
jgi:predicted O-linked N-acetylglucosamine transferase (SPINDLY family)